MDSNAVITLETIGDHPESVINVTVVAQDGSATRGCIYAAYVQILTGHNFYECPCNDAYVHKVPTAGGLMHHWSIC